MSIFDSILGDVTDLFGTISDSPILSKAATSAATALVSKGSAKSSAASSSSNGEILKAALLERNMTPPTPTKTKWGADINSVDPSVIENKWNRLLTELISQDSPTATTPGRAQKGYQ